MLGKHVNRWEHVTSLEENVPGQKPVVMTGRFFSRHRGLIER